MYNNKEEEKMIDYLCNILCYIVELLTVNCKKIYYVRRKQEGHKMDWGILYTINFLYKKILHYQPIRIELNLLKNREIVKCGIQMFHLNHIDHLKYLGFQK